MDNYGIWENIFKVYEHFIRNIIPYVKKSVAPLVSADVRCLPDPYIII